MLNHRQQKFLTCYLASGNAARAAHEAQIATSTGYKYLADPEFNAELSRLRVQELKKSTLYLQSKLQTVSEILIAIVENENTSPAVRIQACQAIFANVEKCIDRFDILDRISALERKAENES